MIETYPRVVWKVLDLPGKPKYFPKNRDEVWSSVGKLVSGSCEGISAHQIDAVLCAYTAFCYSKERIHWFGEPGEGLIVTPAIGEPLTMPQDAERIEAHFRCFRSMC